MYNLVRLLLLLSIVWFLCEVASAQVAAPVNGFCEQGGLAASSIFPVNVTNNLQQSFPSCTVTVFNFGTSTLSTIFSNSSGTAKANPFTANSTGQWQFYAANGDYIVQISGGGLSSPYTLYSDVIITGATQGIGGTGTTGTLPVFTASSTLGNSVATQTTSGKNALEVNGGGGFPGELDFGNVNNSNVIGLISPSNPVATKVFTLPAADGANGTFLGTNGSGVLSFSTPSNTCATCVTSAAVIAANQVVIGQDGVRGVQQLGSLGTTTTLLHGNAAGAPTYATVTLTTDVGGILPVANGGTGVNTLTLNGVLIGNNAGALTVSAQGAAFSVLTANAGTPSFTQTPHFNTSLELGVTTSVAGSIIFDNSSNANQLILNSGATNPGYTFTLPLNGGTNGQFLQTNGAGTTTWASPTGSGTVNNGTLGNLAFYAATGTAVSPATGSNFNLTNQSLSLTGAAISGGVTLASYTPGAHTNVTTNIPQFIINGTTLTLSAGVAEEDYIQIGQPSYAGAFTLTNPAVMVFKGANTASGATLTNNTVLWIQDGATTQTVPLQVGPFRSSLAISGGYSLNSPAFGNIYQISSYLQSTGTAPAVAGFFQGDAHSATSTAWGVNTNCDVSVSNGVCNSIEADFEATVALGTGGATGIHVVAAGGNATTQFIDFASQAASQPPSGLVFNIIGGIQPLTAGGTMIKTNGAVSTTNGIDFSSATLTGSLIKGPSTNFNVLGTGAVSTQSTVTLQAASTTLRANGNLQIQSADAAGASLTLDSYAAINAMRFRRADGPSSAPTALVNNEQLFGWNGFGWDGTGFVLTSSMQFFTGENWDATHHAGQMATQTIGGIDEALTTRTFVDSLGNVNIGNGTAGQGQQFILSSVVFANLDKFSPGGVAANGTLLYCSNCTIASPCAAGGTGAIAKRLNATWVCN